MNKPLHGRESGGALLWIVIFVAVATAVFLISRKEAPKPKPVEPIVIKEPEVATPPPTPEPTATPEPSATPEIVVVPETPVPTPTPRPPLTISDVTKDRTLWPKEIALTRFCQFPAMMDGRVIGTIGKPAGSIFRVAGVSAAGVEVSFNNAPLRLPVSSTDLLVRAEALRPRPELAGEVESTPSSPSFDSTSAKKTVAANQPGSDPGTAFLPASKLLIETVRVRKSRIEGGDYDDKVDHISLRIKMKNPDPRLPSPKLKGVIYIFADSILNRGQRVLLGRSAFDCNLAAREETVFSTPEFNCAYDTTGARFGYKYAGWIIEFKDQSGSQALIKASMPTLEKISGSLDSMKDNGLYDKDFKLKSKVEPMSNVVL